MVVVVVLFLAVSTCVPFFDDAEYQNLRSFLDQIGCDANATTFCPLATTDRSTDCVPLNMTTPKPLMCNARGRVVAIDMTDIGFSGKIPSVVGALSNLVMLDISNGPRLRVLKGAIPTEIGLCTNLVGLWLGGNNLSLPLPSELGLLTNLRDFSLRDTGLSVSVLQRFKNGLFHAPKIVALGSAATYLASSAAQHTIPSRQQLFHWRTPFQSCLRWSGCDTVQSQGQQIRLLSNQMHMR